MKQPHPLERALPFIGRITWTIGLFTILYGFWAWFALGRKTGLMIALAIMSAGPLEDLLNRRPWFGLSPERSLYLVDQLTSILFLFFLLWAISSAL